MTSNTGFHAFAPSTTVRAPACESSSSGSRNSISIASPDFGGVALGMFADEKRGRLPAGQINRQAFQKPCNSGPLASEAAATRVMVRNESTTTTRADLLPLHRARWLPARRQAPGAGLRSPDYVGDALPILVGSKKLNCCW